MLQNDPLREWLREQIRENNYPDKPSRLSCSFVFDNEQDAINFRDCFRIGHVVYEVVIVNKKLNMHKVCYTAWDNAHPNPDQQAHDFWSDPVVYSTNNEIFVDSDLEVKALVDHEP